MSLLRLAPDISAGEGSTSTSRVLFGCWAPGASQSTLEHAALHHLPLDIVQPGHISFKRHGASKYYLSLKICQEAPGEVGVEILPVNHVQDWVELVSSNCDAPWCWDEPAQVCGISITLPSHLLIVSALT